MFDEDRESPGASKREGFSWCRLWHELPNDPKFRVVARRSGASLPEVISVFITMLTTASAARSRGTLEGWNDEDVAASLDMETERVEAIREAMQGKLIEGDRLLGWEKRQPENELWGIQLLRTGWNSVRADLAPLVFARDGHACVYCGAREDLTVDHVLPLSRGGTNDLYNLVTACRPCNSSKNAKTPQEWEAARR